MADADLIFIDEKVEGPGTHVLLVGVGTYDYLVDGSSENLDVADSMEQLDAPAKSVKAIADWLLDGNFHNGDRPLASVAMIVSAPDPFVYAHEASTNAGVPLPSGTAAEVVAAIRAWLARASTHRESMTIFYFCGHGIFAGNSVLLCRDYGEEPDDRFAGAINFDNLCSAMQTKIPEYQIFLADACRTPDDTIDLLATFNGAGLSALSPSKLITRGGMPAKQSVHLATSTLAPSYGRIDGVSVYADALLRALAGGGAQIEYGMWVGTDGLQNALGTYTPRLAKAEGVEQEPDRIRSGRFKIHKPTRIEVPVYFTCNPEEAWHSKFKLIGLRGVDVAVDLDHDPEEQPGRNELEFLLESDKYSFSAVFGETSPYMSGEGTLIVHPPEAPLCLPIERRPNG